MRLYVYTLVIHDSNLISKVLNVIYNEGFTLDIFESETLQMPTKGNKICLADP